MSSTFLASQHLSFICHRTVFFLFAFIATQADGDPQRVTPATYEYTDLSQTNPRAAEFELKLKKNLPDEDPISSRIAREDGHRASTESYAAVQTLGSLAFVLILFGFVAYWLRRGNAGINPLFSGTTWKVLGKGNLGSKHDVQLVRLGNRILLLGTCPHSIQTLMEITDPEEVRLMLETFEMKSPPVKGGFIKKIIKFFFGKSKVDFDRVDQITSPAYVERSDV